MYILHIYSKMVSRICLWQIPSHAKSIARHYQGPGWHSCINQHHARYLARNTLFFRIKNCAAKSATALCLAADCKMLMFVVPLNLAPACLCSASMSGI